MPDRPHKVLVTATASLLFTLTAYYIARVLFGVGGGMLAPSKAYSGFL